MTRRLLTWVAVAATIGTAVFIANAVAQSADHVVKAVDPGAFWDPDEFEAQAGDVVSFEFDQAGLPHNVVLRPPNDELPMDEGLINITAEVPSCDGNEGSCPPGHDPVTYTLGPEVEDGNYLYLCTLHAFYIESEDRWAGTMVGTIGEAEPDPDPWMPNPTTEPGPPWEVGTSPPQLRAARAQGRPRGMRMIFNVSHRGRVDVRLRRGGRVQLRRVFGGLQEGRNVRWINRNRLSSGRYRVVIRYRDAWGIEGQPRVVRRQVRVRY